MSETGLSKKDSDDADGVAEDQVHDESGQGGGRRVDSGLATGVDVDPSKNGGSSRPSSSSRSNRQPGYGPVPHSAIRRSNDGWTRASVFAPETSRKRIIYPARSVDQPLSVFKTANQRTGIGGFLDALGALRI